VAVVKSLPDRQILFVPDQYLADWVQKQAPEKAIIRYPGFCPTHLQIKPEEIQALKREHPAALVVAHPECPPDILALADHVASTEGMVRFSRTSGALEFIIVTEREMVHRLRKENPAKTFYPLGTALCPNMKKTTLPKLVNSLREMVTEITIPEKIAVRARQSVQRMIEVG
jgi:quinolinate synthase